MLGTDWLAICTGVGVIITAVLGGIATIIGARNSGKVNDVHAAVTTPPDSPTLGQVVADIKDEVSK